MNAATEAEGRIILRQLDAAGPKEEGAAWWVAAALGEHRPDMPPPYAALFAGVTDAGRQLQKWMAERYAAPGQPIPKEMEPEDPPPTPNLSTKSDSCPR